MSLAPDASSREVQLRALVHAVTSAWVNSSARPTAASPIAGTRTTPVSRCAPAATRSTFEASCQSHRPARPNGYPEILGGHFVDSMTAWQAEKVEEACHSGR